MIKTFEAVTANDAWKAAASKILYEKDSETSTSRAGDTREILHAIFSIQNPRQRWVVARHPAINPAFAIAEVVWIMNGRNDSAFLNFWNRQLPKYAGSSSHYHGAYGYRLRRYFGIDQIERAYQALLSNPAGRQVILQIWDCNADFPNDDGKPTNVDIPCNIMSLLKVRKDKLEWTQILRSNDLFRGVPYNFIQFTTIQEVLAGWLGVEVGAYTHLSDSLHIYDEDMNQLQVQNEGEMSNTDLLSLPKPESERAFVELGSLIDRMIKSDITEKGVRHLVSNVDLPRSYNNLLLVMVGELARRKRWNYLSQEVMMNCTNPMLIQVWSNWQQQIQLTHLARVSMN